MSQVICFGNLQLDVLCRTVTSLPPPGGLRMIDAVDFMLSGNAANVAAVLGKLGIDVELAAYSGADLVGEQMRTTLQEVGVGIEKLERHPTAGTGTSVLAIAPGGERSIIFVNGANSLFDLDHVPDAWLRDCRIVSVGSVFILPQFTGEAVGRLFARARAQGATTVLNICWDEQGLGLSYLQPALAETDYFVLSYDEGRQLTGKIQAEAILEHLAQYTRGQIVLTLGAEGCCLRDGEVLRTIPACPVEAADCTGAGDSFLAGFIAGLCQEHSIVDSARLGCKVASYAVTGPGSYPRVPALADIKSK